MATATQTNGTHTAQAPAKAKGFGHLRCPLCGEEATITLDLDDCANMTCPECGDSFTADHVREMIDAAAKWRKVLAWLDAAPAQE